MPTEPQIEQQVEGAWAAHRSYLVDLAFRMLGDIGQAEDVVQEAFTRLSQTDVDAIADQRGWLIVVTSRLCLDQIGSARSRHEFSAAADNFDTHPGSRAVDPADRVTLDDSIRLALLVVLERLSPAERVAYVLHDIFQVPFDAVAETIGRPEPTCRQLARRARKKLESSSGTARMDVTAAEHRAVTERFIAACASGSFEQLLAVLDPDVSGGTDLRPGLIVSGAPRVARNILTYWRRYPSLVSLPVAGQPGVLAFVDRDIAALIVLTVRDERITKIHVHAQPAKLDFLRQQLDAT
jgi:RNA polymerase sigma-70 factor (ECF subfamily)